MMKRLFDLIYDYILQLKRAEGVSHPQLEMDCIHSASISLEKMYEHAPHLVLNLARELNDYHILSDFVLDYMIWLYRQTGIKPYIAGRVVEDRFRQGEVQLMADFVGSWSRS